MGAEVDHISPHWNEWRLSWREWQERGAALFLQKQADSACGGLPELFLQKQVDSAFSIWRFRLRLPKRLGWPYHNGGVCQIIQTGLLRSYGVETEAVETGEAAVELIVSGATFNLIIIEMLLPVLSWMALRYILHLSILFY